MYENAEEELKKILALVDLCPDPLKADAFKILLEGYVRAVAPKPAPESKPPDHAKHAHKPADPTNTGIPAEVQTRLNAMAMRRAVPPAKLATLFDFTVDPFTFAPLNITGANKSERTKNVALAVAARSFLATGKWQADWAEIKAMATDQSCYDVANFSAGLKKLKGQQFKSVEVGDSVELSTAGITEAEQLLATLANA